MAHSTFKKTSKIPTPTSPSSVRPASLFKTMAVSMTRKICAFVNTPNTLSFASANVKVLLVLSLGAAMLLLVKKRYFVAVMAGDMVLNLLQKVARGDFHYWMWRTFPSLGALDCACGRLWGVGAPHWNPINGAPGLLVRVMAKTVTDFTGVIQFRHPYEVGGLYWTVSMFLVLLASFASVWIYTKNDRDKEIEEGTAWALVGYLGGGWLTTFGSLLLLMKKKYRGTFFTTDREATFNGLLLEGRR